MQEMCSNQYLKAYQQKGNQLFYLFNQSKFLQIFTFQIQNNFQEIINMMKTMGNKLKTIFFTEVKYKSTLTAMKMPIIISLPNQNHAAYNFMIFIFVKFKIHISIIKQQITFFLFLNSFFNNQIQLTNERMKNNPLTVNSPQKNLKPGTAPSHKRVKSKQLLHALSHTNFSEKICNFAAKKPSNVNRSSSSNQKKNISLKSEPKEMCSPRNKISKKSKVDIYANSPYKKSPKISINMEIKNLNFFGNQNNKPKKRLHKKTISALVNPNNHREIASKKQNIQLINQSPKNCAKLFKHKKAKSQQTIKIKPFEWSDLLANHTSGKKIHKDADRQIISKFAVCNRGGFSIDKKNKINQDAYILIENFLTRGRYLFGVCDGHGINGHYVSQFIKQILPENIQYYFLKNKTLTTQKNQKAVIESSLKDAFGKTAKNLAESGIDVMFSGSTACLTFVNHQTIFCANLGDSRAMMFSRPQNDWSYKELSYDHKGEDQRQAYRIKMNGGRVFPYRDEDGQQMGPYRVWTKEQNVPGLAMTRSFGDYVASTVGVISEPQVISHEITKDDKFMVIASDGLWQFILAQEVIELVVPYFIKNDVDQAVKHLQKAAVEAWKREDQNIDDITIQLVFFKYY